MADSSTTWINETREVVDRASDVVQTKAEFEALRSVEGELDKILRELPHLEQAAALGRGTWWAGVDPSPALWSEVQSAQKDLDRRQLESIVRQLMGWRKQTRDAIQAAWVTHVASQTGDAGRLRDLVQVLSGAQGLADVAGNLDEVLDRLTRLQKGLPNAQAVSTLEDAVELLHTLEMRLPDAVKEFVSAAARGGASLHQFDAEVRDWLIDNGALHNFRVIPGRPQEMPDG